MPDESSNPELAALAARLGRGSPAGLALSLLYNLNRGKEFGNYCSLQNKRELEGRASRPVRPAAEGVPKFRKDYKVPHFRKQEKPESPKASGRRPQALILQRLEQEQHDLYGSFQASPKGPPIDDAEKERLALLMEFKGRIPQLQESAPLAERRTLGKENGQLQRMFESTCLEVEQLQQELQMVRPAQETKHLERNLIAAVRDMHKIHDLIQEGSITR